MEGQLQIHPKTGRYGLRSKKNHSKRDKVRNKDCVEDDSCNTIGDELDTTPQNLSGTDGFRGRQSKRKSDEMDTTPRNVKSSEDVSVDGNKVACDPTEISIMGNSSTSQGSSTSSQSVYNANPLITTQANALCSPGTKRPLT